MERYQWRYRANVGEVEYFYPMKAIRRVIATITVTLLAFRAVASFLSWVEKQDEIETDAWIDEDEFEDA